jgi:Ca2+-transporting ATPase
MLWVNLIMDTCGALALSTEEPDKVLLKDPPHARSADIMNAVMYRNIFGQAIYQITVLLTLLFAGQDLFGLQYDENISGFYLYVNGEQVNN